MAGPVQPAFVQAATTINLTGSTTSMAPALTGVAAGNTLVVAVSSTTITSGYVATGITDTGTATWVRGPVENSSAGTVEWWYGINASSGTHTLTIATNSGTNGCWLAEFSGCANVAPIVDTVAVNTATATSVTVLLSPANTNELLLYATVSANTQTVSPSSPYTAVTGPTLSAAQRAGIAYVAANGLVSAYAPSWTQTSGVFAAVGLALKGATQPGDLIYNDTAAQANVGIFEAQARPDYIDSVLAELAPIGVGVLSGCAVSPNTGADFNFQVAAGTAMLYWGAVTVAAATAQPITAANASNPRRDLVYVTQAGTVSYLAGVANATPCPPSLPMNCVPLAVIEVPANATVCNQGTNTADAYCTDKRSFLSPTLSMRDDDHATTGALAETISKINLGSTAAAALTSTDLFCNPIAMPAGLTFGHITFCSGGTGAGTPTHWWFCLLDQNRNLLAVTADQTTTAWAGSTVKTLAVAKTAQGTQSTFTTTYSGLHYLGIMVVATTVPNLAGATLNDLNEFTGTLSGNSTTGLSTAPTFPFTGASISQTGTIAYAYVSA